MVASIYATVAPARNHAVDPTSSARQPALGLDASARTVILAAAALVPTNTLSHLVSLIPDHPSPLGAVMALVDEGLLGLDLQAPFGGEIELWRCPAA
jgi:hypothetical protein